MKIEDKIEILINVISKDMKLHTENNKMTAEETRDGLKVTQHFLAYSPQSVIMMLKSLKEKNDDYFKDVEKLLNANNE